MLDEQAIIHETTKHKRGFSYLNAMFAARHHKVLWKPVKNSCVMIIIAFLIFHGLASIMTPYFESHIGSLPQVQFLFLLILMFTHRGSVFCEALFFNCDHSMLTYRFYRMPKAILKNFWLRFRTLWFMNVWPMLLLMILVISLNLRFHIGFNKDWLLLLFSMLSLNTLLGFHHLFLYVIFQPYSAQMEIKNYTMIIVQSLFSYLVIMSAEIPNTIMAYLIIGITLIYMSLGSGIIYYYAPKTYRLKS